MNKNLIPVVFGFVVVAAFAICFAQLSEVKGVAQRTEGELSRARDSLAFSRRSIDSIRGGLPGLGEYMSSIQLHAAKLWYAERASNWLLASYELHELGEAVTAVEGMHVMKNTVDVSAVLESVQETQMASLEHAIVGEDHRAAEASYNELLSACNGCHRAAGYGFIDITLPRNEPVTNQKWDVLAAHPAVK